MLTAKSMLDELITCNATCVECANDPAVPVMLIVELPNGVPALVIIVRVDVLEFASVRLIVAGANDALAPDGRPLALRFTAPVKPANGVTVIE